MTEQEYCDLSDLQLLRVMNDITHSLNAFDKPNEDNVRQIKILIRQCIKHLEPIVSGNME